MKNQKFKITGMMCSACQAHVEKTVKGIDGIKKVNVNLLSGTMDVSYDEKLLSGKDIISAVKKEGYGAEIFSGASDDYSRNADQTKRQLILSIAFLVPLMFVSMSHMTGIHIPIIENMTVLGIVEIVFLIPIHILNRKYFISGFKSLFKLNPNMDALIALGAGVSALYSVYNLLINVFYKADVHFYFESAGMILTFITIGKFLENKSKSKTTSAISKLVKLTPKTALILRDGKELEVETDSLNVKDIVICKNGMSIPVDGRIVEGSCSVNESAVTGESVPVDKNIGDNVTGGTVVTSGYVKVEAVNTGKNTTLSKIIKLVEEAAASKASIARIADKLAAVFVPAVIGIAIITTLIWLMVGAEVGSAVSFGIAVLVISCPCALGLATPTAIMVGTGKAAQYGILIKSAEALEMTGKLKSVLLDKTGTITKGEPAVTDVIPYDDSIDLLQIAYALENSSEHPLAKALVKYAESKGTKLLKTTNFKSITGSGISAEIDGKKYYSGNYKFISTLDIEFDNNSLTELYNSGKTPLIFADEKKVIGVIAEADTVKESSKEAAMQLKALKIEPVMLTGDNEKTAEFIRKTAGIDKVFAQISPREKAEIVSKYKNYGGVAMVGDGVNDSPALVSADVGIAIGAGTDIAIDSADIVLMKNDLRDVVTAVKLSKAVLRNIKQNLFWAFIYNLIFIPLAAGAFYTLLGWRLQPMFGTIAMSLSSICVVFNALRLKRFKEK